MNHNISKGDLLYRSKNFIQHTGVYLGENKVFHSSPKNGVEITSLKNFAEGLPVKIIHTHLDNTHDIEKRVNELLCSNNTYRVCFDNCEHVAHYVASGEKNSPQLQGAIFGVFSGLFLNKKLPTIVFLGLTGSVMVNASRTYDMRKNIL